jgi:DNA/RNA endonuclease YhcR with UshA esterase domain
MSGVWPNLLGTSETKLGIGFTGPKLKNTAGNLVVRNAGDSADANVTAAKVSASGNSMEWNSDATSAGSDWMYTISRPAAGMTAAVSLTLPVDDGTANQVLQTDGTGTLSWATSSDTSSCLTQNSTSMAFGSSSPTTLFTLPANAVIDKVSIIVDTAYNGTPSISVGITGTASKYVGSTQVDLTAAPGTRFDIHNSLDGVGTTEALIATYSAGGATAGASRVIVSYSVPA